MATPATVKPSMYQLCCLLVWAFGVWAANLALAVAAAVTHYLDAPAWVTYGLLLTAFSLQQWHIQRCGGWRLIGPHAYYDLIRMGRKGRTTLLRIVYLAAVLAAIWYTYENDQYRGVFHIDGQAPDQQAQIREWLARFNLRCAYAWLFVQNLTILVLTPAYVGGALAEERECGTLDVLFTTGLYRREIVLGALMARLVHLGVFLLAGLPIMSLMLVWGGIDVQFLLGQWLNSALLLVAAASMSITFSVMPIRATRCVVIAYACVVPAGTCCTVGWSNALEGWSPNTGVIEYGAMAGSYALISAVSLAIAIHTLKPGNATGDGVHLETLPRHDLSTQANTAAALPYMAVYVRTEESSSPPRTVTDDGLFWKECYTGERSLLFLAEFLTLAAVLIGYLFVLMITIEKLVNGDSWDLCAEPWEIPLALIYAGSVGALLVRTALRAGSTVVRERQQQTLDMLLLIPVDRREILRAKWYGTIFKSWPWLAILASDVAVGTILGAYHPVIALTLLAVPLLLAACLTNLGLLVSLVVRTAVQANLLMAAILAPAFVCCVWFDFGANRLPTLSWWTFAFNREEAIMVLATGALVSIVSWCAWLVAVWRFERLGCS